MLFLSTTHAMAKFFTGLFYPVKKRVSLYVISNLFHFIP